MEKVLCIWGDSLTMGMRDMEKGGRANHLQTFLWKKHLKKDGEYNVAYNLGIDGDTSEGILKRFDIEAEAREPNVIIFATGANDCTYTKDRKYTIPVETFRANMINLITKARKFTDQVVIIGLITCDESRMVPIPRVPELSQDMEGVKLYNNVLKEVAVQENVLFIDVLDTVNNKDLEDGCHPTEQGHEKMYIRIRDILLEKKII